MKCIWICSSSKLYLDNPDLTLGSLRESSDYNGESVWLEFGVRSLEEMTQILVFFRKFKEGLHVLSPQEYNFTYYDFTKEPLSREIEDTKPDDCWFAVRVREDIFLEFWKCLIEFCRGENYLITI